MCMVFNDKRFARIGLPILTSYRMLLCALHSNQNGPYILGTEAFFKLRRLFKKIMKTLMRGGFALVTLTEKNNNGIR